MGAGADNGLRRGGGAGSAAAVHLALVLRLEVVLVLLSLWQLAPDAAQDLVELHLLDGGVLVLDQRPHLAGEQHVDMLVPGRVLLT